MILGDCPVTIHWHKIWRKIAKKVRRKRIRQRRAAGREKKRLKDKEILENDPFYQQLSREQARLEEIQREEEQRIQAIKLKQWFEREHQAQNEWQQLQQRLIHIKNEKSRQEELIRAEFKREQQRLSQIEKEKEAKIEQQMQHRQRLAEELENYLNGCGDVPDYLKVTYETHPDKELCPFFEKTGSCRFYDNCSRNHRRPSISRFLLIRNLYTHLRQMRNQGEYDTDIALEFDDEDLRKHFEQFYADIVPEFENYGRVQTLKVCCNYESHLSGNVYVEYEREQEAVRAYQVFHGRWYGGKQLNVEFVMISSWNAAVCGVFARRRCPKGRGCNFLHLFQPARNLLTTSPRTVYQPSGYSLSKCRWSESPEPQSKIQFSNRLSRSTSKRSKKADRTKSKKHSRKSKSRSRSHNRCSRRTRRSSGGCNQSTRRLSPS